MASKTVKTTAAVVALCGALAGSVGAQAADRDFRFLEANVQLGIPGPAVLVLGDGRAYAFAEANEQLGLTASSDLVLAATGRETIRFGEANAELGLGGSLAVVVGVGSAPAI